MNIFEKKMADILSDLAQNYDAIGVKAEFEDEGTAFDEALRLKELALYSGLDLTLKIGGCSAIKDIQDAKIIGAGTLVAPMIESAYAVKKYYEAYHSVFEDKEINDLNFFINIETIQGSNHLDEILKACDETEINGIVIGRTDFTNSLGMNKEQVDNEIIYDYAKHIALVSKNYGKEVTIGGGITETSIPFLKKISGDILDKFEIRKIIFNFSDIKDNDNMLMGISKALEFEIMWLKNKTGYYNMVYKNDIERICNLEKKYKSIMETSYV